MPFDYQGAIAEGYSDTEIIDHLMGGNQFDLQGARNEGYSDAEIAQHLSTLGAQEEDKNFYRAMLQYLNHLPDS